MIEVKPCPFCKFEDVEFSEVDTGTIAVDCPDCRCIGPFAYSYEEAAAKWNEALRT